MGKKKEEYVPTSQVFRRALEATLRAKQALGDALQAVSKAHGYCVSDESRLLDGSETVANIVAQMLARQVAGFEEQEKKLAAEAAPAE